jgi:hypothetical protein
VKITETIDILNGTLFEESEDLARAWDDVQNAVQATDWPHGSGSFTIYPQSGKKRGEGNGVKPIKVPCINELKKRQWRIEGLPPLAGGVLSIGDLDAFLPTDAGYVGFEWETGNISSSHRAINKLLLTLQSGGLIGGLMTVPSDAMKPYLTDRIGNIAELRPYFPLWKTVTGVSGALRIVVVEHDATSFSVAKIPKGTDGRATK